MNETFADELLILAGVLFLPGRAEPERLALVSGSLLLLVTVFAVTRSEEHTSELQSL